MELYQELDMNDSVENKGTYPTIEEGNKIETNETLQQQEDHRETEEETTLQEESESDTSHDPLIEDLPDIPIMTNVEDKLLTETEIMEKHNLIESKLGIAKIQFATFCKISQITQNFLIPTTISNRKQEDATTLKFRKSILLTPLEESVVLLTTEKNLPTSLEETRFLHNN